MIDVCHGSVSWMNIRRLILYRTQNVKFKLYKYFFEKEEVLGLC